MQSNFLSVEEKEKIFCTELVKYGVKYKKARKAAKILASGLPDELLSAEEILIVKEACKEWSVNHRRYEHLKSLIEEIGK
ncbi:MAG: hypothetical protein RMX96_11575 [Nostoc sp. ChiSLP02]|nr:hypothetical protein [Nostoc sp. DedSLP05]MDZ8099102.1 hypothetical protein [Nostoc sp. DedSLP01]MDZ8185481.1 hypothetical protein [Nostoc sp. ChiSLP02]